MVFPRVRHCDMLRWSSERDRKHYAIKEVRSCDRNSPSTTSTPFERSSKRRKGFPSETHVKRGQRVVHADKELTEKLGRNDLCPCQSGRRFQTLLPVNRVLRRRTP